LAALPFLREQFPSGANLLDLGSGAGWPGLALAIELEQNRVILLDSTRKKVQFLRDCVQRLGLASRVTCEWGRCDTYLGRAAPRSIDAVLARAVAPISKLLAWIEPGAGRTLVAWKGESIESELQDALPWLERLHMCERQRVRYQLPGETRPRHLLVLAARSSAPVTPSARE
jgi:16S rRNA (guanine527-N7)-methyltransferase